MTHTVLRFGLPPVGAIDATAVATLLDDLAAAARAEVRLVHLPTYASLFDAVDWGRCDAAWAPPLVAVDLESARSARTIAALDRGTGTSYHAAIVARRAGPIARLADLERARVGWVAPESAAGYVVPRLHLASLGVDLATAFGEERFYGSHAAAARALALGAADAIATFASFDAAAGRVAPPLLACATRVIAAAGPIPSDVIVARPTVSDALAAALADRLAALPVDAARGPALARVRRFVPATSAHLAPLRRWRARGASAALRVLALPAA